MYYLRMVKKEFQQLEKDIEELENSLKEEIESINQRLYRRWYDNDPILSLVIYRMEHSSTEIRERIAMEIIKIIISNNISNLKYRNINEILDGINSGYEETRRGRWYDINPTVRTAIGMLQDCPVEMRHIISKEIKKYIMTLDQLPI